MNWENLTATEFKQAMEETGVCVIAMGVLEKHSEHLPLGTDYLNGHKIAMQAALKEKAVVFPPFYFGQIYEARCFPGTLTIKPTLLLELVTEVLDEISRNGFKKIIIYNAHGGNYHFIQFLAQTMLYQEKPYQLYSYLGNNSPEYWESFNKIVDTKIHAHACECETSITLYNNTDTVKMDKVPEKPAVPLKRLNDIPFLFSGLSWYADCPEHYCGDARTASIEKGRKLTELEVNSLAEFIKAVKNDTVLPMLSKEFFEKERNIR